MRVATEIVQRTYCECGAELFSADDWSKHKRQHTLEYWNSTPEGRRTLELLRACGFTNDAEAVPQKGIDDAN